MGGAPTQKMVPLVLTTTAEWRGAIYFQAVPSKDTHEGLENPYPLPLFKGKRALLQNLVAPKIHATHSKCTPPGAETKVPSKDLALWVCLRGTPKRTEFLAGFFCKKMNQKSSPQKSTHMFFHPTPTVSHSQPPFLPRQTPTPPPPPNPPGACRSAPRALEGLPTRHGRRGRQHLSAQSRPPPAR